MSHDPLGASTLEAELDAAGGVEAPPSASARLREVLAAALRHGREELAKPRSGYESPVEVAFPAQDGLLLAATPVDLACPGRPSGPEDLALRAGESGGALLLAYPAQVELEELAELAPDAFAEQVAGVDRLRAAARALPPGVLEPGELREPIGAGHLLRVAEAEARLGAEYEGEQREEALLALLGGGRGAAVRPHEDPDPARRVARRILQRLDGMGKWGGYHTDFAHLARGFAGNDRQLASDVGEALLSAGLLAEKPSVGQRHVFLNPRRAGDIRRLIETGEEPSGLSLARK